MVSDVTEKENDLLLKKQRKRIEENINGG